MREFRKRRSVRNLAGKVIPGDIELLERRLVERREDAIEAVELKPEVNKPVKAVNLRRDYTGEVVIRKVEHSELVERD